MGSVKDLKSKQELDSLMNGSDPIILHFWASWCEASKQMDQVFSHLSTDFPQARFYRVEAEEQPEISETYSVSAVPFFVFCKGGKTMDTLEGANPSGLANKVAKIAGSTDNADSAAPASLGLAAGPTILETVKEFAKHNGSSSSSSSHLAEARPNGLPDSLKTRLHQLVNSHPIFVFMKGTPDQPKCGFSRKVVDILNKEGVRFGSLDILSDNEVREGMKKFSEWPTFPQLYCKGEFLGGCDITVAMHESGELKQAFADKGVSVTSEKSGGVVGPSNLTAGLTARLEQLVNTSPVMVFMKGTASEPKCGFSSKVVDILREEKVAFSSFDILSDDEVRQGLKVYSNWSSYPQVYVKGELIGGSDIVLEMHKSGELGNVFYDTLESRLKDLVSASDVMLFMKGTPDEPKCGFSSKVVNALRHEGVTFGSFDILSNEEVRQGLKDFSNWPTFPQLYYKGELIGGCDIVMELATSGELKFILTG